MNNISWSEFRSRLRNEKGLVLVDIDQFSREIGIGSPSDWFAIPDWEELDDFKLLDLFYRIPNDELVVIGEVCYSQSQNPLIVNKGYSIKQFASEYLIEFGESLFNGDMFIFGFAENYIGIFHHEGLCYEGKLGCTT